MFDRFGDWLAAKWDDLKCIEIIPCYDAGVLLRTGKYMKTLPGGDWYFKWPFIEEILTETVVMTTLSLPFQKIETKDKKGLVCAAVLKYEIDDIATYLLKITDQEDALVDMPMGIIREVIEQTDYTDLQSSDKKILARVRNEAKQYGIKILKVTFTTRASMRALVLMHEGLDLG